MGILKFSFIILLLLFPLGQIARLDFQNGVAVTLSDIAVGVVVLVFLFANRSKQKFKKSLTKPIIIFAAIGLLSLTVNIGILNTSEFIISLLYGIRWILYAGIFFVVSGFDIEFKKIITKTMIIIGGLVVLGGYVQYFLYQNLRNLYYLGWDEHLYRMFSSFLDPNFAGAFFVLYFILVFGLTIDFLKRDKKNYSLFLSLLSISTLLAILLTYSRSALIMLIVGSFTLFFLKKQKKLVFMILAMFVIFFIIASKNFYTENLNLLRMASSKARLESASHAVTIIRDNPILGVGFNAYKYAQVKYGFIKEDKEIVSHSAAGTDNSFLFVLATTGVVGLASYLFIWFKILKNAYYYKRHSGDSERSVEDSRISNRERRFWTSQNDASLFQKTISVVILASSIGIFANAFFINSLFYPSIMLWMWVLVGLIENKN